MLKHMCNFQAAENNVATHLGDAPPLPTALAGTVSQKKTAMQCFEKTLENSTKQLCNNERCIKMEHKNGNISETRKDRGNVTMEIL